MKILHLIPSFGSGGAERQLSILAPALVERGVECHVGYCVDGPNIGPLLNTNVILHQLDVGGNHDPRLFLRVWKLIRTVRPDVVQTWILQMDVVGGMIALLMGVPFILSERSSASAYVSGWKTLVRSKIGLHASAIVANSQGGADYWADQGPNIPIHLIRNCVVPTSCAFADVDNVPVDVPLILFAGRLSQEKNVVLLLRAFIDVVNVVPECIVVMFGEGPLLDKLSLQISSANTYGRIRLEGYTDNLSAWLRRADVCVSISDFEGSPNVVLEAAGQGCPLVLSDIPAHREVFDETSVWFVEHKSVDEVRDGILRVLSKKQERAVKAEKAKQLISSYTHDVNFTKYIDLYLVCKHGTSQLRQKQEDE
jgi:glycosyltransferase involved in cell wall biosynthesis